jgi:limonene-1,2-epoxide hydrolase
MGTHETVVAFMAAINGHDVDAIVAHCAPDHSFIDAHGGVVEFEALRGAWTGYFQFMPHYGVSAEVILCERERAAVFGAAWGGLNGADPADRAWRRPCAWRAEVRDGRIRLWQVYVDTKAVFDLL